MRGETTAEEIPGHAAGPEPRDLDLRVAEDDAGGRLDAFLARSLDLTRRQVRRLLASERVALAGDGSGPNARPTPEGAAPRSARALGLSAKGLLLDPGWVVSVRDFRRPEDERPLPDAALDLRVLARGEGWLAVDKPAGVPVHPLRADERGAVLNALVAREAPRFDEIHRVGEGGLRGGVVHRLDVDTSGVLLVGWEELVWQRLRAAFREHRVAKRYRTIVHGAFDAGGAELRMEHPLVVASHRPARVRVCDAHTRGAVVTRQRARVLEALAGGRATLVEVALETGFLHQIRATLAHAGHPVMGDPIYSPGERAAPRQMLHCARVALDEDTTGGIEAESPDPADFASHLAALRADSSSC